MSILDLQNLQSMVMVWAILLYVVEGLYVVKQSDSIEHKIEI